MNIAIFCTGSNPVPPKNYGGTQAVNWETANALVDRGHNVLLFAPKGSKSSATVIKIYSGWGAEIEERNVQRFLVPNKDNIDVIIDTSAYGFPGRYLLGKPYVARMGGDPNKTYCRFFSRNIVWPSQHHLAFHSMGDCSCSQRRPEGCNPPIIQKPVCYKFVENILDVFPLHETNLKRRLDYNPKDYYLYLGLIAQHKGTHLAIEFASRLGVKLNIVGPKDKSNYFETYIKPKLTHKIQYFEGTSNVNKWGLLAKAKAVIFPSTCEEGDPNVPKESLLVGTPVIALDGTVAEIIEDKVTGIVCKDVNEMLSRHREILYVDPYVCKEKVLEKFGVDRYIEKTLKVLDRAIKGEIWI